MSDISLGLNGLFAMLALWVMAVGYFIAAIAFCVASLRTGRRRLYGPRMVTSALLGVVVIAGSFLLKRFPNRILDQLDDRIWVWAPPAFLLGLFACLKLGKR